MTVPRRVTAVPPRGHLRYANERRALERRLARLQPGGHLALRYETPDAARTAAGRMRHWSLPATLTRRGATIYLSTTATEEGDPHGH